MRNNDPRSRCIALLPDALVNAHLLAKEDPRRHSLQQAFAILDRAGFGIVQLPPDDLPLEPARVALDFALDQTADYLKHGYRFLWVDLSSTNGPPLWRSYFEQEIARLMLVGIETHQLQPGDAGLRILDEKVNAIRRSATASASGGAR
jgi:hypothetical protein